MTLSASMTCVSRRTWTFDSRSSKSCVRSRMALPADPSKEFLPLSSVTTILALSAMFSTSSFWL